MSDQNGATPKPAPKRAMTKRLRPDERLPAAGQIPPHGGIARTEFFGRLRIPMVNGTGKKGS